MWTERHRARHAAHLKHMISNYGVREVVGWLKQADPPNSDNATPTLAVVRVIASHLRVDGRCRRCMPPWRTVYSWFRRWQALGLFERIMRDLARLLRRAAGHRADPRLAIIDMQTVKCIPARGPRGLDTANRVLGRKRVAMMDADGRWLAIAVVPASVQERDTLPALDDGKAAWHGLRVAILDSAFTAERCREWSNPHGMRHEVVVRLSGQRDFALLPRRWVVERSFGWLTHWGGLLCNCAGRLDVATAHIACAAVLAATEALINPA